MEVSFPRIEANSQFGGFPSLVDVFTGPHFVPEVTKGGTGVIDRGVNADPDALDFTIFDDIFAHAAIGKSSGEDRVNPLDEVRGDAKAMTFWLDWGLRSSSIIWLSSS